MDKLPGKVGICSLCKKKRKTALLVVFGFSIRSCFKCWKYKDSK